jgi:glucose-6-phosphate isomerase
MQLPDEAISYHFQSALVPAGEEWTAAAELRARHFLPPNQLRDLQPRLMQVRSQIATERGLSQVPAELQPLDAGFIDLPQKTLDQFRRQVDASTLGHVLKLATNLRQAVDRVVILGVGGSYLGPRALFEALRSTYHNDLPTKDRPGIPRIYFEGNNFDNDALHELLDMLQLNCVDPQLREERWGAVVISKTGRSLETAAAFRAIRREMTEFYGHQSPHGKDLLVPITGTKGKLRDLCLAQGLAEDQILTVPDDVGGRFSVFSPVGLLPAAVMGLDVRALLLGAASMTRCFLDEPFERNPVLQFAAVNYLMFAERKASVRVLSIWSRKLEAVGLWYDHLLAESLGKHGQGQTPITAVQTRDLHVRGQQHQEGPRDKMINNLVVKTAHHPPIMVGMMDHNEDDLNCYNRKGLPDLMSAAHKGTAGALFDVGRPAADLVVPAINEHTVGQLLQLLMLATVVEGRLLGINPYGEPGLEAYKRNMQALLK